MHKAGFVSILGKPNVGKSTLMNQLVGERLSIITAKAQTTRHRIMGIINADDFQIVYSDTPGIILPKYELHKAMMEGVRLSLEDADVVLLVIDATEKTTDETILNTIKKTEAPCIIVLNKVDLLNEEAVKEKITALEKEIDAAAIIPVSALHAFNLESIFDTVLKYLPEHPPFFPKDALTDKPEHFFAAEVIREKIFLNYKQEIPYATEVHIASFKEDKDIIKIRAEIYVERKSQKGILIGKGGSALKRVGIQARKDLEVFFGKKIFLEQYVKVIPDWRKRQDQLKRMGYKD